MRRYGINLAGEGEVPGVLNQQPPFAVGSNWYSTTRRNRGKTLANLISQGHAFVICPNEKLPFPDETFEVVYTNSVPIDRRTHLGPTPQSAEIKRVLTVGGIWIHDGRVRWRKP